MENPIFRKKSMKRLSSPEEMNDYIKVANPGIWVGLAGVAFLLAGVIIWAIFGRMDSRLSVSVWTSQGKSVCYVKEEEISSVTADKTVTVDGKEYSIREISDTPVVVTEDWDLYLLHVSGLSVDDWVYEAQIGETDLPDGVCAGSILTDSTVPISFVLN